MNRKYHAHPKPDPNLRPDSARRDIAVSALAMAGLIVCWLLVSIR